MRPHGGRCGVFFRFLGRISRARLLAFRRCMDGGRSRERDFGANQNPFRSGNGDLSLVENGICLIFRYLKRQIGKEIHRLRTIYGMGGDC